VTGVDLLTPATIRHFEDAVANPMFWSWLDAHAHDQAMNHPAGHPWHSWLLRVHRVAADMPAARAELTREAS